MHSPDLNASQPEAAASTSTVAPAPLPDDAWIDVRTIGHWLSVSPSWVFRETRTGAFPEPIFRGHRMTRWHAGTVRQWMRERQSASTAKAAR